MNQGLRGRLGEMAAEAVMVVFAVMVALAVDEWREDRQMLQYADKARDAVLAEARANLVELDSLGPGLRESAAGLAQAVEARDVSAMDGVSLSLPELSSAAWQAAQVSQAATHIDYEWMIQAARAYETAKIYADIQSGVIDVMAGIVGRAPTMEAVDELYGRVLLLLDIHRQVADRFRALEEGRPHPD